MDVRSFTIDEVFASTTYVLSSNEWVILIDPWYYSLELSNYLHHIGTLDAILITHWHGDHIRDIDKIKKDFPSSTVYIHKDDVEMLTNPYLNCARLVGDYDIIIESNITAIEEWKLKIWWYDIQVIHTPWHTYGGVMYYFIKDNALFLWDTILWNTIGTMRIPTWNEWLMYKSLEKFKNLNLWLDTITYSWHWDVMKYWDLLKINNFL